MSEDIDAKLAEGEKKLRKKHPELNKEVNISIDTKNVESIIERLKEKELENKQLREKLEGNGDINTEDFEKQAEFEERMRTFVKQLKAEQEEQKLREASENDYDVKEGGKGNLSLSKEQRVKESPFGSHEKGYPSYEEMIDDLAQNDPETLQKLKEKWQSDIEKNASQQPSGKTQFVWKDPMTPNPKTGKPESALFRQIRLKNEEKRKKHPNYEGDKE